MRQTFRFGFGVLHICQKCISIIDSPDAKEKWIFFIFRCIYKQHVTEMERQKNWDGHSLQKNCSIQQSVFIIWFTNYILLYYKYCQGLRFIHFISVIWFGNRKYIYSCKYPNLMLQYCMWFQNMCDYKIYASLNMH